MLFGLLSCENQSAGPSVASISPSEADTEEATTVTISGEDFFLGFTNDLETGTSTVESTFELRLSSSSGEDLVFDDLSYVDTAELIAVLPAGLQPGFYDAQVRGPLGAGNTLPAAIKIFGDVDKDNIHDDIDGCVDADKDGIGRTGFDRSDCADDTLTDSDDTVPVLCADSDSDGCDDCVQGSWMPNNDGEDKDGDGICVTGDHYDCNGVTSLDDARCPESVPVLSGCISSNPVTKFLADMPWGFVESGNFGIQFDTTPNAGVVDSGTAISFGDGDTFEDYGMLVRFMDTGIIEARDGGVYRSATPAMTYAAGTSYRIRFDVDFPARSYSIFVAENGSPEKVLGLDFAFRADWTEAGSAPGFANWNIWSRLAGTSHDVCDFTILRY